MYSQRFIYTISDHWKGFSTATSKRSSCPAVSDCTDASILLLGELSSELDHSTAAITTSASCYDDVCKDTSLVLDTKTDCGDTLRKVYIGMPKL